MSKTDSSRLNVLYIIYVLANYSDEEHPMSAAEIRKKVDAEFSWLSVTDGVISLDTIKRTLEELTAKLFMPVQLGEKIEARFGYAIYCVMKQGDTFVSYNADAGKQPPKKYYYYENSLKTAELLTLKDAVETYSYFSEEDVTELIQKILKLRPMSFPKSVYYDVAGNDRDENSLLLMNIEYLNDIIKNHSGAKITYCAYNLDKKLVPRPGYPKVVEPVHLMWSNGYYYLLAYNEKYQNIVSFRVDRITEMEEVALEHPHREESFNPVSYRHEHPVMYGGEKEKIVLLCRDTGKNYIMNTIVDVFGKNARVLPASEEMVRTYTGLDCAQEKERGVTWLKVTLESTIGGVELWAAQYCNDCVLVSPEEARERVKQRISQGYDYYKI